MAADVTGDEALLGRFDRISVRSRGGVRAPHKPLLLLLALEQARSGGERWLRFTAASKRLGELLGAFGSPSKKSRPDHPYWRLVNDGVWALPDAQALQARMNKNGDVPLKLLRELDARAGFPDDVHAQLAARPDLVDRIARRLVERNFPEAQRQDVLRAVGLSPRATT